MIGEMFWPARITGLHHTEDEGNTVDLFLYSDGYSITLRYVTSFSMKVGDFVRLRLEPQ